MIKIAQRYGKERENNLTHIKYFFATFATLNDTQTCITVMDTLLKETVNATVNSRYPGMAPEGRRQLEEILVRREWKKANFY